MPPVLGGVKPRCRIAATLRGADLMTGHTMISMQQIGGALDIDSFTRYVL